MSYLEYCENEVATQRKALKEKDERIEKLEALIQQQDTWLGKKTCAHSRCSELVFARNLLREVIGPKAGDWYTLERRVEAYFDACDTLEGK